MQVLAATELIERQALDRQFHGVHRIAAAGQHRHLHQVMKRFLQGAAGLPVELPGPGDQPLHPHAVFRECAGLIDRQHRGATQAFHRRRPAGQHANSRQPQGPQGQEQGQHHRDFVGQQGQGQGQGRQQRLGPVAADAALAHGQQGA